jgi:hypothetical protein
MNDIELINKLTRRDFTENELYIFPVRLCDNEIDRDYERFSDTALEELKTLFIGKTGIFDHNPSAGNQAARVFDTEVAADNEKSTSDGRPYKYLKAKAYMVRTAANKALIDEIDAGIKKEVSISCSAVRRICSVCGCDRSKGGCSHEKGKMYGEKLCHTILDGITDAYEWSFVAVPAQINAGVTKKYIPKEEKSMDFTPINTQEELDAAVKTAVDAAVAETEKKFSGWLSPESAAALTKERDDLSAENNVCKAKVMKMQIAAENGIPLELAENMAGDSEEDIRKEAQKFAKYLTSRKVQPTPKSTGDTPFANSNDNAKLEMLRELRNN